MNKTHRLVFHSALLLLVSFYFSISNVTIRMHLPEIYYILCEFLTYIETIFLERERRKKGMAHRCHCYFMFRRMMDVPWKPFHITKCIRGIRIAKVENTFRFAEEWTPLCKSGWRKVCKIRWWNFQPNKFLLSIQI